MIRFQRQWIEYESKNHWDGYCRKEFLYLPKTFEAAQKYKDTSPKSEPIRIASIKMAWINDTDEPVDYNICCMADDKISGEALKDFEIFFPKASTILQLMMAKPIEFDLCNINNGLYKRINARLKSL